MSKNYDIIIIGGGPAGTTIGSLLAEKGWSVALLEKSHHPRFHIGESLLPMNLPIFERLGVLEEVAEIGIIKYAAEFNSLVTNPEKDTFYFAKAQNKNHPFAYQVRRSEFDEILFNNCKRKGVNAFEGVTVNKVDLAGETKQVWAVNDAGEQQHYQCRYIVDASGRDTFLANRLKTKQRNPQHQMAAIFGHFHDVERRKGDDAGNISIYWFAQGWIWLIPLKDGMMSIGCVCWPDYLKSRSGSLNEFLWQTLALTPQLTERLKNAKLATEAQATGNYSYRSSQMVGDGYLLIGDAYAFVDPVFSSGVYLAMKGASNGAELVDGWLKDSTQQARLAAAFQKAVHAEIDAFCWFIYRFNTPALHKLLMASDESAQHPVKQKMKAAVISVLAGDAYNRESQFYLRLFKALYYLMSGWEFKENWLFQKFRNQQNKILMTDNAEAGK
jgi:flavin-dependent dehydrogenase